MCVLKESNMWVHEVGIENCWCKSNRILVENIDQTNPPPFRQTFWPDKWGLREGYGGPNLGEKGFQLFQFFID